jgi:hypothetical protein
MRKAATGLLLLVLFLCAQFLPGQGDANATNFRKPTSDADTRYWLENMVWHHHFTTEEISAATGLNAAEVQEALTKFGITPANKPRRNDAAGLLVVPYPGGRHPRIGFLDGAVRPQRETKASVFAPWDETSYVVVDVPEAIWSNLGLIYLAHTHVPTIWTRQDIDLERLEWNRRLDGSLDIERRLPNGISFGARLVPLARAVHMELWLTNGSREKLTDLRVQNCVLLKGAAGFNEQTSANKVFASPYVACRSTEGKRWIITAWEPCQRAWDQAKCPCLHSDPKFPDCSPGETVRVSGWLSFYEGTDIQAELKRIDQLGWRHANGPFREQSAAHDAGGEKPTRQSERYRRIKARLDAVPAIDTHDHLWPFDKLPGYVETEHGKGMNLYSLWRNSYYSWNHSLTPWKAGGKFEDWWSRARHDFDNARAASFYRYQLPAFQDLYGVDFERISDAQARDLNDRIFRNYLDQRWLYEVVTERANIELMFNDPYWARLDFRSDYPFGVLVFNVTTLVRGFHPSEFTAAADDPYHFAKQQGLPVATLDDYLAVLERLFVEAKAHDAVCLKTTLAYQRTLRFENVPKEKAARAFGRRRAELSDEQVKDFEDFIMWRLVELSARHGLPFQIHTGQARIQGSNPMLLVDLIEANPRTKFILFHGGFPWIGETGVIVMRHGSHVWIDSVWLPTLSYTAAKRAFHEWLEAMPSNRIMWGADCNHAEGIYGATEFTRRCLAEVLTEKVERGDLLEEHALHIGQQILRDNALELFPKLRDRLWKRKGKLTPPK